MLAYIYILGVQVFSVALLILVVVVGTTKFLDYMFYFSVNSWKLYSFSYETRDFDNDLVTAMCK